VCRKTAQWNPRTHRTSYAEHQHDHRLHALHSRVPSSPLSHQTRGAFDNHCTVRQHNTPELATLPRTQHRQELQRKTAGNSPMDTTLVDEINVIFELVLLAIPNHLRKCKSNRQAFIRMRTRTRQSINTWLQRKTGLLTPNDGCPKTGRLAHPPCSQRLLTMFVCHGFLCCEVQMKVRLRRRKELENPRAEGVAGKPRETEGDSRILKVGAAVDMNKPVCRKEHNESLHLQSMGPLCSRHLRIGKPWAFSCPFQVFHGRSWTQAK
jgi:hypothetical protein